MIDQIRHLLAFSDTARYNIKAVVQQTQVNVSTLRAWEQRYGVPQPTRTDHGHRLYSQRDIEIIKWLKKATEDGIAISQAVSLLHADPPEEVAVTPAPPTTAMRSQVHISDAGWPDLRHQIADALMVANMRQAHALMNTAITLFPVDALLYDVVLPILDDLGNRWMYGENCTAHVQVAVQFIRQRLAGLMQVHAPFGNGTRLVCGAGTGDEHDIGSMVFALLMEQQAWDVVYMGPNVNIQGLSEFLLMQAPAVVVLSASMIDHVVPLQQIGQLVVSLHHHGLRFGYAGRVFVDNPELCRRMPGTYMGDDFVTASQAALVMSDELANMSLPNLLNPNRLNLNGRVRFGLQ